jgi:hypothetical protein
MIVENLAHNDSDAWRWRPATGADVADCVALAEQHFESEITPFQTPSTLHYSRNLTLAVVNQFFSPQEHLLMVARHVADQELMAYTWAERNHRAWWSEDEIAQVNVSHCHMQIPARTRLKLISQQIDLWETWAQAGGIPVVCSTTMREDQAGFLRLHEQHGFVVRGSFAYLRVPRT